MMVSWMAIKYYCCTRTERNQRQVRYEKSERIHSMRLLLQRVLVKEKEKKEIAKKSRKQTNKIRKSARERKKEKEN